MFADEAAKLKPGDVILVRVVVTEPFKPGSMGHHRGWINCKNVSDTDLLGVQELVVSCADAVTPKDLKALSPRRAMTIRRVCRWHKCKWCKRLRLATATEHTIHEQTCDCPAK